MEVSSRTSTYCVSMESCNNGGGELLVDLLSIGQLDVCKIHDNPNHPQIYPCQFSGFFLSYTHAEVKSEIFMELLIKFGVEGSTL